MVDPDSSNLPLVTEDIDWLVDQGRSLSMVVEVVPATERGAARGALAAIMALDVLVFETREQPVNQSVAEKAKHLPQHGMTDPEIGRRLGFDRWTVGRRP